MGPDVTVNHRLPLAGIRALELGHIVAGPSGGLILADLGADVIKVEEPRSGDQSRGMPNRGATFYAYNRNKRSLAVDLKSDQGREIFGRLVQSVDVVLDNYAPGVLDRRPATRRRAILPARGGAARETASPDRSRTCRASPA